MKVTSALSTKSQLAAQVDPAAVAHASSLGEAVEVGSELLLAHPRLLYSTHTSVQQSLHVHMHRRKCYADEEYEFCTGLDTPRPDYVHIYVPAATITKTTIERSLHYYVFLCLSTS